MLINLCYNPNKTNFIDFSEQLTLNIVNAFTVSNKITLMGHNNINYLNRSDKDNMESVITPYGFKLSVPMMRRESVLRHKLKSITLIVTMKQTETHFVLIHLIKRTFCFTCDKY